MLLRSNLLVKMDSSTMKKAKLRTFKQTLSGPSAAYKSCQLLRSPITSQLHLPSHHTSPLPPPPAAG